MADDGTTPEQSTVNGTDPERSAADILKEFGEAAAAGAGVSETGKITPTLRSGTERLEKLIDVETLYQRARREAKRRVDAEERPPHRLPVVVSLDELLRQPDDPIYWRVENWQPVDSRILFDAQFKAGKTTAIGNLIRSLADGAAWLNRDLVNAPNGRIVLLDFEMSARHVKSWLRDQGIHNTARVDAIPLRGLAGTFDIRDDKVRAQWADLLRQRQAGYIVWDCLRPVIDALGLDENRDCGRLLVAFDALLAEAGITEAAVVHHMGHVAERARGDSRLRDWPDAEWRLLREDMDDPASDRFITAYGRDVDVPESKLQYNKRTRHLTLVGGSRREQKRRVTEAEQDAEVYQTVASTDTPMSIEAIRKATGRRQKTVKDAVQRLQTAGQVRPTDEGKYTAANVVTGPWAGSKDPVSID